jgi:hypothetical protein
VTNDTKEIIVTEVTIEVRVNNDVEVTNDAKVSSTIGATIDTEVDDATIIGP